jgi:hypothetical protein
MRIVFVTMFALAIGTGAFALWGLYTVRGRQSYDEMAGVVPLAAGLISIIAFIVGVVALALTARSG